jgi:hypothetical protein
MTDRPINALWERQLAEIRKAAEGTGKLDDVYDAHIEAARNLYFAGCVAIWNFLTEVSMLPRTEKIARLEVVGNELKAEIARNNAAPDPA